MMDRLTEKDCYDLDSYKIEAKNLDSHCVAKDIRGYVTYYGQHIDKLAEYENLEEQGLLLRLLCKVGTIVYAFLPNDNHFTDCQINKIEIKPTIYGNVCYFIEPIAHRGCLYRYFEDDFGKTVFLTLAEAEQKLKEMESN